MNLWVAADRVSDRIIELLNEERKRPDFSPVQCWAGQLLALLAFGRTAPVIFPAEFGTVLMAADRCLTSMLRETSEAAERPSGAGLPKED